MADYSYLSAPIPSKLQYKSIVDIFNERTTESPHKEILIHRFFGGDRKVLTYGQLQEKAMRFAQHLIANGIKVGDSVAIIGQNSLEWAIGEIAILMSGGIAVHIQKTTENFEKTLEMLKKAHCKALLIDPGEDTAYISEMEAYSKKTKNKDGTPLIIFIQKPENISLLSSIDEICSTDGLNKDSNYSLPAISPESAAIIYTSSGSTGVPKMAVYTHFAIVNGTLIPLDTLDPDVYGIQYNDRPFSWLGGSILFNVLIGNPRVFVDTKLSLEKGKIADIWNIIVAEKCNHAIFLPFTLTDLIQRKEVMSKSGYKLCSITTGGQVIGNTFTELTNTFCEKLLSLYGSTEIWIATRMELTLEMEPGDVGKLFPAYEIKIVGGNDETLERGRLGEILVRSPFAMKGYRNELDLNQDSFDDGKWFRTGDVGIITKDDKLYVKGKTDDVIKRGGVKTLSSEVERVIAKIDGVEAVAVLPVPDDRLLEEVCACFVLKQNSNTTENDIKTSCYKELGDNLLGNSPSFYLKFDSFPRLSNGKTDKVQLKEKALKMINVG